MENSRVHVLEAVVIADDSEEKFRVLSQISGSREQPAIPKFTLLHVETRVTLDEELRIVADFHRPQPFVATISATRVEQTLVGRGELGVFKEISRVETLLTELIEVLDVLLTAKTARFFANLKSQKKISLVIEVAKFLLRIMTRNIGCPS